jgi:non-ribosomal peptide synthetase component F
MTPWLPIALRLWLGQTPDTGTEPVSPLPETEDFDPASRELRDAREAAREDAETLATPGVTPPFLPETRTPPAGVVTSPEAAQAPTADTGIGGSGLPTAAQPVTGATAPQTPADAQGAPATEEPTPWELAEELRQLRTQVQSLQERVQAREEEAARTSERALALEQQQALQQQRAQELEQLRQQRLAQLDSAEQWLIAADQALTVGELGVDTALQRADEALGDALGNAADTGQGTTVLLLESARNRMGLALEAVNQRNTYIARFQMQSAGEEIRQARLRALAQPDTTYVNQ